MEVKTNDEIDIIDLLKKLYNSRKIIIYTTIIFSIIGIAFAFLLPLKYNSTTVFITQNQETRSTSLSGVANLVGINLGSQNYGNEIPLSLYPKIFSTPQFKRGLLHEFIDMNNSIKLHEYISNKYNLDTINNEISNDIRVSKTEESMFEIINSITQLSVNLDDGFVTISTNIDNAEHSAIISKKSREILQSIIIKNRIEKANQTLKFTEEQLQIKRKEFEDIQSKLSLFKDTNLNIVNNSYLSEQSELEAEFEIINSVVIELSKQVEEAKIQVKRDSPIFSTIKEVTIPNKRSSPKRKIIVLTFIVIGFLSSTIFVLTKDSFLNIYKLITNQ